MGRIRSSLKPEAVAFAIEPEVASLLGNWGRWAARRADTGHNSSPLGRVALRGNRWDSVPQGSGQAPDQGQAWEVERTVCLPAFSPRWRALLTMHYVHGKPGWAICDGLHILRGAWDREHARAAGYFWELHQARLALGA